MIKENNNDWERFESSPFSFGLINFLFVVGILLFATIFLINKAYQYYQKHLDYQEVVKIKYISKYAHSTQKEFDLNFSALNSYVSENKINFIYDQKSNYFIVKDYQTRGVCLSMVKSFYKADNSLQPEAIKKVMINRTMLENNKSMDKRKREIICNSKINTVEVTFVAIRDFPDESLYK